MPTLVVEFREDKVCGHLGARLIIGRMEGLGLVLADRQVSRLHAWIDQTPDGYQIVDSGSRNGTIVNRKPMTSRRLLADGDQIQIGSATISFHTGDALPDGIDEMEFVAQNYDDPDGILFDCVCGAPLWVSKDTGGKMGQCRHCRNHILIPTTAGEPAQAIARHERAESQTCSICQTPIGMSEKTTPCPECGLLFHVECWKENCGCSAYGCPQVNVLAAPEEQQAPEVDPEALAELEESKRLPVEFLLLGGSVLGSLVGILTWGLPALATGAGAAMYFSKHSKEAGRSRVVAAAAMVSMAGFAIGMAASYFWWMTDSV